MENSKLNIYTTNNWNKVFLDGAMIMEGHDIDIKELFSHLNTNYDVDVIYTTYEYLSDEIRTFEEYCKK